MEMGFQELLNHGTRGVSALVSPGGHVLAGGALEAPPPPPQTLPEAPMCSFSLLLNCILYNKPVIGNQVLSEFYELSQRITEHKKEVVGTLSLQLPVKNAGGSQDL